MRILLILILLSLPFSLFAAEDFYHFKSTQQQKRFEFLTNQLRCLVCQNQNIADSNAPLANDLRDQIYLKIQNGQSNNEIIEYLVARYGDFIRYRPPLNTVTLGLWFGPLLLLISGVSYLLYYILKKQRE